MEYLPTRNEAVICVGIWAFGFLFYTALLKVAVPILTGRLRLAAGRRREARERPIGIAPLFGRGTP